MRGPTSMVSPPGSRGRGRPLPFAAARAGGREPASPRQGDASTSGHARGAAFSRGPALAGAALRVDRLGLALRVVRRLVQVGVAKRPAPDVDEPGLGEHALEGLGVPDGAVAVTERDLGEREQRRRAARAAAPRGTRGRRRSSRRSGRSRARRRAGFRRARGRGGTRPAWPARSASGKCSSTCSRKTASAEPSGNGSLLVRSQHRSLPHPEEVDVHPACELVAAGAEVQAQRARLRRARGRGGARVARGPSSRKPSPTAAARSW